MEFKVGEYEYQEALVRIKIESQINQSEPTASNVVMHVDIPDTDDRGIAEITSTAAPTKVYYNKHYYKPPDISVTLRGGNTSNGYIAPYIVSTSKSDDHGAYFEVELLNEKNERKTGTINWVAKGY